MHVLSCYLPLDLLGRTNTTKGVLLSILLTTLAAIENFLPVASPLLSPLKGLSARHADPWGKSILCLCLTTHLQNTIRRSQRSEYHELVNKSTVWVFGDQLNQQIGALRDAQPKTHRILMIESHSKIASRRWHVQRAHFIIASMRRFAAELRAEGFEVDYRFAESMQQGVAPIRMQPPLEGSRIQQLSLDSRLFFRTKKAEPIGLRHVRRKDSRDDYTS